ncbi:MAG: hypothetical protein MUF58_20240 [Arcicella sp.]|nr:hypothetical protein [Arcicella sp.]
MPAHNMVLAKAWLTGLNSTFGFLMYICAKAKLTFFKALPSPIPGRWWQL